MIKMGVGMVAAGGAVIKEKIKSLKMPTKQFNVCILRILEYQHML